MSTKLVKSIKMSVMRTNDLQLVGCKGKYVFRGVRSFISFLSCGKTAVLPTLNFSLVRCLLFETKILSELIGGLSEEYKEWLL